MRMFYLAKTVKNDEDCRDDGKKAEVLQSGRMKFLACSFSHGAHSKCCGNALMNLTMCF